MQLGFGERRLTVSDTVLLFCCEIYVAALTTVLRYCSTAFNTSANVRLSLVTNKGYLLQVACLLAPYISLFSVGLAA